MLHNVVSVTEMPDSAETQPVVTYRFVGMEIQLV